jgi:Holliday junction resolvase
MAGAMSGRPPWERARSEWLKPVVPAQSAIGGGASPYRLGKAFEHSVKQQLQRRQFFVVRSPGSRTASDLLAVGTIQGTTYALFIQCKRTGTIGSSDWNAVCKMAWAFGGWAVVAFRESPRTTAFYRLDDLREPRKKGRPWTRFDPATMELQYPPLQLV